MNQIMKRITSIVLGFIAFATIHCLAADNPELDRLQGKWECKKKDEQGNKLTLTLEIKKDKLKFKMEGDSPLVATADVKLEKLGPFKTFTAIHVKAGSSEDALDDVSEDFSHVYQLDGNTLYVVSNFDQQREQAPSMDVYKKLSK